MEIENFNLSWYFKITNDLVYALLFVIVISVAPKNGITEKGLKVKDEAF